MKYYISIILVCTFLIPSYSQDWQKLITGGGSSGNEIINDMDVDDEGNVYIVGTFSGVVTFGTAVLNSNGSTDFYVVKFDSAGNVVYAMSNGSTSGDFGNAIVVDNNGNAYITGQFNLQFNLQGTILSCFGSTDIFTAKIDSLGNVVWAKRAGGFFNISGDEFRDRGVDIELDNTNGLYVAGIFGGQAMTFGANTLQATNGQDFLGKYDLNGNEQWIVSTNGGSGSSFNSQAKSVTYNAFANSLIVSGENNIATTIGAGGTGRISNGYIRQVLPNGNLSWFRQFEGSFLESPEAAFVDGSGQIYVVGSFNGSLEYPAGNIVLLSLNDGIQEPQTDAFILKFNQNGSVLLESKAIIADDNVTGHSVFLDNSNNIYWAGGFEGGPSVDNIGLLSSGESDAYLIRLNSSFNIDWIETAGGPGVDRATNVFVRDDDKIVYSGGFNGIAQFGNQQISSQGFSDAFIAILDCKPNLPTFITGDSVVCVGDTSFYSLPNKIGTENNWSLNNGGILDTTNSQIKVVWTTSGKFDLLAIPQNVCGIGESRSLSVRVRDIPDAPSINGDTNICVGLGTYFITQSNPEFTYQWTLNSGGSLVQLNNQALVTWNTAGNYTLSSQATNACGLGLTGEVDITVSEFPSGPFLISGNSTTCLGTDTFSINTQVETQFTWDLSSGGTVQSFDSFAVVTWNQPGTFVLRATPSNICGTGAATSQIVTVNDIPSNISIQGDSVSCIGSASYSVQNLTNSTYSWSSSGGGNILNLGNTSIVNWTNPGNFEVYASVQNACGQSNIDTFKVEVTTSSIQPGPIQGSNDVCLGTSTYSVAQQVDQIYSWNLSSGGTLNFVNNQANVNWTSTGNHTLSVSTSNDCGAGQTRSIIVNVKDAPNQPGVIFGNDDVCLGLENYNVFAENGVTYNWSISGGGQVFPSGNSTSINWTLHGTYDLEVTPSNSCGSGVPRILAIEVNDVPDDITGINGIDTVCLGSQTYSIQNPQNDSDITYNWNLSGGGVITPIGNSATVNWTSPGTFTITARAQNSCGFGQPFSKIITVRNVTEQFSTIDGDDLVCLDTSNYSVNNIGGFTYNWSLSGGGIINASGNQAEVIWQNTGEYSLNVTSSDGCTKSLQVEVLDIPKAPSAIGGDSIVCIGTESYAVQSREGETFNWSVGSPASLNQFGNAAIVAWNSLGVYNLSVSASNICGIGDSSDLEVNVLGIPDSPDFTSTDTLVCLDDTIEYEINADDFEVYSWSLDRAGLIDPSDTLAKIVWLDTGIANISVNASNLCGSGPSTSLGISIKDIPIRPEIFGFDKVCLGSDLYTSSFDNSLSYNWSVNNGALLNDSVNTSILNWTDTGIYTISLSTQNLCGSSPIRTRAISVFDIPEKPILIQGDSIVCVGLSSYEVLLRPEENYTWQISSGGNLTSLNNSATINWTSTGFKEIYVSASNLCGTGENDTFNVEVKTIPNQPSTIAGLSAVCLDTIVYSVNSNPGIIYNWNLNGNGQLFSGDSSKSEVSWNNTGIAILSVSASNLCGTGPTQSLSVSISDIPSAPSFISGDTLTCIGVSNYQLSATSGNSYNWLLNGGGTVNPAGAQAQIDWTQTGNWNIIVSQSNFCGTSPEDTLGVRIKTLPDTLNFINPDTLVCLGNIAYEVNPEPEVNYSWSLNGGGSFSFVNNQAFVTWSSPGVYSLSVSPTNICGSGPQANVQIDVNDIPEIPQFSNLDSLACLGQETYSVNNQTDVNFLWNLSGGGGSSSNNNQFNVNWTNTGIYQIQVSAFNFCGSSSQKSQNIFVEDLPDTPIFSAGDSISCIENKLYVVNIDSIENVVWSLSGGGLLTALDDSALVDWIIPGDFVLRARAENYCGLGPGLDLNINVNDIPNTPIGLNGEQLVCKGETEIYSVNFTPGQEYNWNIQNGINLPSDSSLVEVDWDIKGESVLQVSAVNQCGESSKTSLTINVRSSPEFQGGILGDEKLCVGNTGDYQVNFNEGISYSWILQNGGDISAESNSASVNWNEPGEFDLILQAENICGASNPIIKSVLIDEFPTQPQISVSGDTLVSSAGIDNVWYLNGQPFENSGINFIVPTETGRYTLQVINTCGESDLSEFLSYYGGENLEAEVYLIPNPAIEKVEVRVPLNLEVQNISINDSQGRKVGRLNSISSNIYTFNVNNLRPGFYIVKINLGDLGSVNKKLVVN